MHTRFILILLLCVVFFATPTSAYAGNSLLGLADGFGASVVNSLNDLFGVIKLLLINAMVGLGNVLQSVMGMELTNGGPAVYKIWKLLRDLTSMLFIVLLIAISFATIFSTTGIKQFTPFNYRSALVPLIIAALFINMSLSLGQAIVWGGNELTKLVLGLLPPDTGLRASLALKVPEVLAGQLGAPVVIPASTIPLDQLTPSQRIIVEGWLKGPAGSPSAIGLSTFEGCLKRNGTHETCLQQAQNFFQNEVALAAGREQQRLAQNTGLGVLNGVFANAVSYWTTGKFVPAEPVGSLGNETSKLATNLMQTFLILVMTVSFLAIVVFMVARIPMVWFLLATSSAAFFSLAIPNGSANFYRWLKNVVGVSLFGPLYLFVIYIGLFVLSTQGSLVASVSNPQDLPFFSSMLSTVFFYFIAAFIFVGGAAWVFKLCFKTLGIGDEGGGYLARTIGAFGISPERQFGISGVAQRLGITPTAQALQERAAQFGGDVGAGARGRFPTLFGTKEEALARAKERFGVRGAAKEYEAEIAKRIKYQKERLEAENLDDAGLRKLLSSGNRDAALAAGEMLLSRGSLTAPEKQQLLDRYGKISQIARKEFQKRANEQAIKVVGKEWKEYIDAFGVFEFDKFKNEAKQLGKSEDIKKFLEAAMRGEVGNRAKLDAKNLEQLSDLMSNPEDKRAFFETVSKVGRNKVAAIETMASKGLITKRDGSRLTADEALADRATTFSADDWLDAEEYAATRGGMSPGLRTSYDEYIQKPRNLQRLLRDVSGPSQAVRLKAQASDLAYAEAEKIKKKDQERLGVELSKEQEQKLAKDRDAAERLDAQLDRFHQQVQRARQKVADEFKIYRRNRSKQNRDKVTRAVNDVRNAMRDLNVYKKKLTNIP